MKDLLLLETRRRLHHKPHYYGTYLAMAVCRTGGLKRRKDQKDGEHPGTNVPLVEPSKSGGAITHIRPNQAAAR
jgi:hypothetical protein